MSARAKIVTARTSVAGQRGPEEHARRTQILEAANDHFKSYGYAKTTVADLARAIGMSPAYIYKFFESKQAIGEAICREAFSLTEGELDRLLRELKPAATRLSQVYRTVARRGVEVCFNERKLHDLAVTACIEKWQAVRDYQAFLLEIIQRLIVEGRESGEFERKTPLADASMAILQTLKLFSEPLFLELNLDDLEAKAESVANLVLRSLAP